MSLITNDKNLFNSKPSLNREYKNCQQYYPLYKGASIKRYNITNGNSTVRYIKMDRQPVQKKINGRGCSFKNKYYQQHRLFCQDMVNVDAAPPLVCALSPQNCFATNKLNCISIKTTSNQLLYKYKILLMLQGFLSSFTVGFQLRLRTGINTTIKNLKSLHVPRLQEGDRYFSDIVGLAARLLPSLPEYDELAEALGVKNKRERDTHKRWKIQGHIDALVAMVYGLSIDEYNTF